MATPTELPNNIFVIPIRKGTPPALATTYGDDLTRLEPRYGDCPVTESDSPRFTRIEPQKKRLRSFRQRRDSSVLTARSKYFSSSELKLEHRLHIPDERSQAAAAGKVEICEGDPKSEAKCNHKSVHDPDSAIQRYLWDNENDRRERAFHGLPVISGIVYHRELMAQILKRFDASMGAGTTFGIPRRPMKDRTFKIVHFSGYIFQESVGSATPSLTSSSTSTDNSTIATEFSQGSEAIYIDPNKARDNNSCAEPDESNVGGVSSSFETGRLPSIHAPDHEYLRSPVARLRSKSEYPHENASPSPEGKDILLQAKAIDIPKYNHDDLCALKVGPDSQTSYGHYYESMDSDRNEYSSETKSCATIPMHSNDRFSHLLLAKPQRQQSIVQCADGGDPTSVGSSEYTQTTSTLVSKNTSLLSSNGSQNAKIASNNYNKGLSDDDDKRSSKPPGGMEASKAPKAPEPRFRCILSVLYPEKHSSCIGKSFERRHLWGHLKRNHVRCDHCGKWLAKEKNPFHHLSEFRGKPSVHEKKEIDGIDKIDFIGLNVLRELDEIYEKKPKLSFGEVWDKWWKVLSIDPLGDPTPTSTINLEISKLPEIWNLAMEIYEDGVSNGEFDGLTDAQQDGMKEANEKALKLYGHVVKKKKRELAARKRARQDEESTGLKMVEKSSIRNFADGIAQNAATGTSLLSFERNLPNLQQLPSVDVRSKPSHNLLNSSRTANEFTSQVPSHEQVTGDFSTDGRGIGTKQLFQFQQPPSSNSARVLNGSFGPHPNDFHLGVVEPHQYVDLIQTPFEGSSNDLNLGMGIDTTTQIHPYSGSNSTSPYQARSNGYSSHYGNSRQAVDETLLRESQNRFRTRHLNTEGFPGQRISQDTAMSEGGSSYNTSGLNSSSYHGNEPFLDSIGTPLQLIYEFLKSPETDE